MHAVRPQLRTVPGKNIMSLSTSLLLAHVIWLSLETLKENATICVAAAVALHYLFLVAFTWSSIIAFDTHQTFSHTRLRERTRSFYWYVLLGWLSPLLLVIPLVALDRLGLYFIGYGQNEEACWMSSSSSILFFMAVPVGISLVFNIVCFACTLRSIRISTAIARRARASNQARPSTLFVAFKLCTLMSFTWIFGFIAPWESGLWYAFTLFNTLQGVYIFLAFGASKKLLSLCKKQQRSSQTSSKQGESTVVTNPVTDTQL